MVKDIYYMICSFFLSVIEKITLNPKKNCKIILKISEFEKKLDNKDNIIKIYIQKKEKINKQIYNENNANIKRNFVILIIGTSILLYFYIYRLINTNFINWYEIIILLLFYLIFLVLAILIIFLYYYLPENKNIIIALNKLSIKLLKNNLPIDTNKDAPQKSSNNLSKQIALCQNIKRDEFAYVFYFLKINKIINLNNHELYLSRKISTFFYDPNPRYKNGTVSHHTLREKLRNPSLSKEEKESFKEKLKKLEPEIEFKVFLNNDYFKGEIPIQMNPNELFKFFASLRSRIYSYESEQQLKLFFYNTFTSGINKFPKKTIKDLIIELKSF